MLASVVLLSLAGAVAYPQSASAFTGACSTPPSLPAIGSYDGSPGEANAVTLGYRASDNTMTVADDGTKQNGDPLAVNFSCSATGPWQSYSVSLGDRADTARADGAGLAADGFGAVPASIDL